MAKPLYSIEAEESVIGGLIFEPARLSEVQRIINPADFYAHQLRAVYRTILSLRAEGKPIDLLTVRDALEASDELERVGGFGYLAEIAKNTPSAANVSAYASIIAKHSDSRRQMDVASQLVDAIRDSDAARIDELRDKLSKFKLSRKRPVFDLAKAQELSIGMITTRAPELDSVFEECLPMAEPALLTAGGGTGKSFTTVQMGISVSTGRPVFAGEFGNLTPKRKGKVLIIGGEDGNSDYHRRLQGVLQNMHLDPMEMEDLKRNLIITSLVGEDMRIIAEDRGSAVATDMADRLVETLENLTDLRMIIIDPLIRFYGAGENDNHSATMFINQINRICRGTGAAVLLVHHSAKAQVGGARGASAFVDGARTHISMATLAQKKAAANSKDINPGDENKVIVELRKSNHIPYWKAPIMLERGDGGILKTVMMSDDEDREVKRAKDREDMLALLNYFRANGASKKYRAFADRKAINFGGKAPTREAMEDMIEKLEAQGHLVVDEDGNYDVPRAGGVSPEVF
ncbi:MAG: AAA family ATPase [Plesiomonas shigelloides]